MANFSGHCSFNLFGFLGPSGMARTALPCLGLLVSAATVSLPPCAASQEFDRSSQQYGEEHCRVGDIAPASDVGNVTSPGYPAGRIRAIFAKRVMSSWNCLPDNMLIFSRSYCHAVVICLFVRLSVCDEVYCDCG